MEQHETSCMWYRFVDRLHLKNNKQLPCGFSGAEIKRRASARHRMHPVRHTVTTAAGRCRGMLYAGMMLLYCSCAHGYCIR